MTAFDMTPNELAAFNAGIRHAADMALIAALAVETRPSIPAIRARAAVAALQGFADALKASASGSASVAPAAVSVAVSMPDTREMATAQGFTGDACSSCGAFKMQRAGTCLTCQACGATTGCS